jgi:hypothetical protein
MARLAAITLSRPRRPATYRSLRCRQRCAAVTALSLAASLFGCDLLDTDRRPYTPFPVASGAASQQPSASLPPAEPPPRAPPLSREAIDAPTRAVEWRVGERTLTAPDGLVFRLALLGGIEGGGERDVLAWAVGTEDRPVVGELWLYPEQGEPRLVQAAPSFLPTGPGCSHGARLSHAGPSSVTLDIKAVCSGPLLPRAPERSVSVLAPLRTPALIIGFRLAAPARDERLEVDVSAADRDGDGRDDVEMSLRFGTTESADVRAQFVWLQRAAGLSRDMAEPRASFVELAQLETMRAGNQKSSLEVAEHTASVRRLYSSLCAESGVSRIFLDDGAALDCGDLSAPFEALTSAEIDAALSRGQVTEGFAALERHAWFPARGRTTNEKLTKAWLAKLMQRVVRRRVVKLVPLRAVPRALDAAPHYSPLSFHADGSLLILSAEGLVRSAPDGRFEYDASDEVDGWPTAVISPTGEQLTGVAFPCDRSDVVWLRSAADGAPLPPLPTALVAPRPGSCAGAALTQPNVAPLGWSEVEPSAFIGASRVGGRPSAAPMGSALSPNGRYAIIVTRWGLLVPSEDKTTLWTFNEPALASQLSECVVSNNAQAAACLLEGRAHVILPDPKSG